MSNPYTIPFGQHAQLTDFAEPQNNYILFLGDCATANITCLNCFSENNKTIYPYRITGPGFEYDYHKLNFCTGFVLIHAWANGASVIEDKEKQQGRTDSQIKILDSISRQGSKFAIIDRPMMGGRYINSELRRSICENPPLKLGIKIEEGLSNGWKPQNPIDQKSRREAYKSRIKHVTDLSNVYYLDLQEHLSVDQIKKYSSEETHGGGVINEAPWHFADALMSTTALLSINFLNNNHHNNESLLSKLQ